MRFDITSMTWNVTYLSLYQRCRCESLRWKHRAFETLQLRWTHATCYSMYRNNNHCTQRQKVFCHYLRTLSVISCGVSSPPSVLLVFHCCIAIVAGETSQRIFEDYQPLSSVLAFSIIIKFITSLKLVFSGNRNIAYAKKTLRNTMVFFPQKY